MSHLASFHPPASYPPRLTSHPSLTSPVSPLPPATFTPAELGHLESLGTHTIIDKINAVIDQLGGPKVAELVKWCRVQRGTV